MPPKLILNNTSESMHHLWFYAIFIYVLQFAVWTYTCTDSSKI